MTFNWVENALTIDLKLNIIHKYTYSHYRSEPWSNAFMMIRPDNKLLAILDSYWRCSYYVGSGEVGICLLC